MCRIGWWAMLWHFSTDENFSAADTYDIHGGVVSGMRPGWSMGTKDCICPVWGLSVPVCIRITWTLSTRVDPGPYSDSKNHKHWGGTWVSLSRNSSEVVQMQSPTLKFSEQGQQPVHGCTQSGRSRSPQAPWVSVRRTTV